jgi:hypothetical protein
MKEKISNIATANTKFTHDIICSHVELTNSFIDCFTITHIPTKMLDRIAYISYIAIQSKVIIDKNIVLTSYRHLAFDETNLTLYSCPKSTQTDNILRTA